MSTKDARTDDLLRWSEALVGCARTGLGFTASTFEKERFEEILHIAADIRAAANKRLSEHGVVADNEDPDVVVEEWLRGVLPGVAGYNTPRVAVGALVGNDWGELLLVKRADSGIWLYPTGWADIGYSASEVVVKEVEEETGLVVDPVRLAMVIDGMRAGISRIPLYSLVFTCKLLGGTLRAHPLECTDVGFFSRTELPEPLARSGVWVDRAFTAISGEPFDVFIDRPREPVWRG